MAETIGNTILSVVKVDSTNNYASEFLVKKDCKEGSVVSASEQLNGRGQLKNQWESEPLKNILISIVFYPEFLPVSKQFILSKVIALGVFDLISLYVENVSIKWPNDIYVGAKKIAGILIENSIMGNVIGSSIAGIGLNVNQKEFLSDAPNPVSLTQLSGKEYDLDQLLTIMLDAIDKWYLLLKTGKIDIINKKYTERLYQINKKAHYRDFEGVFKGVITGVNEIGQLQIKPLPGKIRTYHFKEVAFI